MVKRIINWLSPVNDLPDSSNIQEELKSYFNGIEEERTGISSKSLQIVVLGILIFITAFVFYIWNIPPISIGAKLVLTIPQYALILKGLYLGYCYKRENNHSKTIKLENSYLSFISLAFMLALGNIGIALFYTFPIVLMNVTKVNSIIIIGQIFYITSYFSGYYLYSRKIAERLLIESRKEKRKKISIKPSVAGVIGGSLYILTNKAQIIPKGVLYLAICAGTASILFILGTVQARNKFFDKLYEKELQ